ncbi:hypothetical protein FSP39_004408 [Pinctada imbricata]|uniref:Kazal-like domain-containing protein n=1 Tax=Pinctada imbricata TaxID=66713 RepID=A0AA89BVD3_PINIB|nr:hypothetical protein FSP39_004408 [Pinctada imbricata]
MSTTPGAPPSTVPPILTGSEAVLDFFCLALAHQDCETDVNYVCGSDATTYLNPCEFEKARCAYREVHLKHEGNCTGDPFNP